MHPSHILQHSLKHVHRRCRWCRCNHTGRCAECRVSWGRCHKWLQCFLSSTCTETVLGLERKNSSHSPMLMLTFMHEAWSIYIIIMGIYIFFTCIYIKSQADSPDQKANYCTPGSAATVGAGEAVRGPRASSSNCKFPMQVWSSKMIKPKTLLCTLGFKFHGCRARDCRRRHFSLDWLSSLRHKEERSGSGWDLVGIWDVILWNSHLHAYR